MSDIVGELLKSIDGNVPVATAKLIDRAADEIAALRSALSDARAEARLVALELDVAKNLVDLLRNDLTKLIGSDPVICEGCGAPIDHDEEPATTADVAGCWGYVSDVKDAPCYRYRTKSGSEERSWPPCSALSQKGELR